MLSTFQTQVSLYLFGVQHLYFRASQVALAVKKPPANKRQKRRWFDP